LDNSNDLKSFIAAIVIIIAVALAVEYIAGIVYMSRELWHINREIERTDGEELKFWRKRKRRLLLSLIPFASFFLRNGK